MKNEYADLQLTHDNNTENKETVKENVELTG